MTEGQKSAYKRRAGKRAAKTAGTQRWTVAGLSSAQKPALPVRVPAKMGA